MHTLWYAIFFGPSLSFVLSTSMTSKNPRRMSSGITTENFLDWKEWRLGFLESYKKNIHNMYKSNISPPKNRNKRALTAPAHVAIDPPSDWYMVSTTLLRRPCSELAVCYYFHWQLYQLLFKLADTTHKDILDSLGGDRPKLEERAKDYKALIGIYAKATKYENFNGYKTPEHYECGHFQRVFCKKRVFKLAYDQCVLANIDNNYECYEYEEPVNLNYFRLMLKYAGSGDLFGVNAAYQYVSRFFPNSYIYASHASLLRSFNMTHTQWHRWRSNSFINGTLTGPCDSINYAICVARTKAPGDVECYGQELDNLPCWGETTLPKPLRPHLKFGRGRSIGRPENTVPLYHPGDFHTDNFD